MTGFQHLLDRGKNTGTRLPTDKLSIDVGDGLGVVGKQHEKGMNAAAYVFELAWMLLAAIPAYAAFLRDARVVFPR